MVREGRVFINPAGRPAYGGNYRVKACAVGAQVRSASSGTTITVHAGHGFSVGNKFIVGTDIERYREVTAVSSQQLEVDAAVSVANHELLINIGGDSGSTGGPNFDGTAVQIYTDMAYQDAPADATVTADSVGRYRYWHKGVPRWELVLALGTPVAVYMDTGDNDSAEFGVNVTSFGATGDGSTDDTDAIQAAIDSRSDANGVVVGGTIWFPAGIYTVTAPITMTSGIVLRGESTQSTRIKADASFSGTEILRWDGISGIGQNPGIGAKDIYLDCQGVAAHGIRVFKGYDGIHFDNVIVDNAGLTNNAWRFELDPDYGNNISQTILMSNCYGIHTPTAGATGEVFYFNSVQEITLVNCKGFGGYAVATGNCDVFHFDGCRGVTILGGAAAISQANGIKIKGTARASQGFAIHGVTFEAVGDSIDVEGNVFAVSYLDVRGSRKQEGTVTPAVTTGGFNLQNLTYGNFEANPSFTMTVDANCNRINFHTELYTNLTSDAGNGTKLLADNHTSTGNTYSVFGQGLNIMVPSADVVGPEIHWGHNAVADYWRMFWSRSSGANNGFYLRYVNTSGTPSDVMIVDADLDPIRFYAAGTERLNITADGIASLGHIQGFLATQAFTGNDTIAHGGRTVVDITNTSGANTLVVAAPSSVDGKILILRVKAITAGSFVIADSGNVSLSAAWDSAVGATVGSTLTLIASGVVWYEVARSKNT